MERKPVTESKIEIRTIWIERMKAEADLKKELMKQQAPSQQVAQSLAMIGKTKILDHLYTKYGVKLHYLVHAFEHYNLENDPEVITFMKSQNMEEKQAMDAMIKDQELNEAEKAAVMAELKKIMENGGMIAPDTQGKIPLDRFIQVQTASVDVTSKLQQGRASAEREARLVHLKAKEMDKYKALVGAHLKLAADKK